MLRCINKIVFVFLILPKGTSLPVYYCWSRRYCFSPQECLHDVKNSLNKLLQEGCILPLHWNRWISDSEDVEARVSMGATESRQSSICHTTCVCRKGDHTTCMTAFHSMASQLQQEETFSSRLCADLQRSWTCINHMIHVELIRMCTCDAIMHSRGCILYSAEPGTLYACRRCEMLI